VLLFVICSTVHGGKESIWQIQILNNVLVLLDALSDHNTRKLLTCEQIMSSLPVACGLLLFRNLKVKLETAAVKV